jgi:Uma2 family endonuclease
MIAMNPEWFSSVQRLIPQPQLWVEPEELRPIFGCEGFTEPRGGGGHPHRDVEFRGARSPSPFLCYTLLDSSPFDARRCHVAHAPTATVPLVDVLVAPLVVPPEVHTDDGALFAFSTAHPDWRVERTARGGLVLMAPAGGEAGWRNARITAALTLWADQDGRGAAFDSSTGFRLPNGAIRSPAASWVSRQRLAALSPEEKRRFLPLCPDFVIELRSPSDELATLQTKMEEYLANGARLGWLLDPTERRVYRYQPGMTVESVDEGDRLAGDPLLPGFTLRLDSIWQSGF